MTRSASTAVAAPHSPDNVVVSAARPRERTPLGELDIAPENLRFGEAPDDDIPLLAETLIAAGQLQPLTVRPGRRKERRHMALDGRRRILALRSLLEAGRIDDDFLVDVFVETDAARQAAAVLLTNTAVPVHVADVIGAIGRMLKGKLDVPAIARALGYAELEVKRLAALSGLPPVALEALKAGRLNLRQARLLARLTDKDEQAELARMALDGHGFQDWRVNEKLDADQVTAHDPRCTLITPEQYTRAGGRTATDLFGERPPILLDPAVLTDLWTVRARELAAVFETEGLDVHVSAGDPPDLPDDLEGAGYVYGGRLPAAEMTAYREARERLNEADEAVKTALGDQADADVLQSRLIDRVNAKLALDQAGWSGRAATLLVFSPSRPFAINIECFTPLEPEVEDEDEQDLTTPADLATAPTYKPPEAEAPEPDVEGVNHVLHAARTDVATRGLIRALADDPSAALTALVARLFNSVVVRSHAARTDFALAITAAAFKPPAGRVIDTLDGEVRQRLDLRRADWEGSGLTVIAWVNGLAHGDKIGLLAELTALTLDLREERTSLIRRSARAEAAELAALCGAEITLHWTPDEAFLKPHSKTLLLGMLEEMGEANDGRAAALRKTELTAWVAERAAIRGWAPASLSWTEPIDPAGAAEPDEPGAGAGAFELTDAGRDALSES